MKGILTHMKLTDRRRLQSTMDRHHIRGDALPRELTPEQGAGLLKIADGYVARAKLFREKLREVPLPPSAR